jgi:transcriptional regulator with XRE-family HTH domain
VSTGNVTVGRFRVSPRTGNVAPMSPAESTVGDLLRALRDAHGLTQEQVADRTKGTEHELSRVYVVRLETNRNQARTERVQAALAFVYGLTREQVARYIGGKVSLDRLLEERRASEAKPAGTVLALRSHPRWDQLVAEARAIRPSVPLEAYEKIADSPFPWGDLKDLDVTLLADLARDVWDWASRPKR